jgi:hypothetical protein
MIKYDFYNTKTKQTLLESQVVIELKSIYPSLNITNDIILKNGYIPINYIHEEYDSNSKTLVISNTAIINNIYTINCNIVDKPPIDLNEYNNYIANLNEDNQFKAFHNISN